MSVSALAWRPMTVDDVPPVNAIGNRVHIDFPEDFAVFAERPHLYPAGCFVLAGTEALFGYVTSHPWIALSPPPLNSYLRALPAAPDTYYIHDLTMLPEAQGGGHGTAIVQRLIDHARALGLPGLSLVAVSGSAPFWRRFGFEIVTSTPLAEKLASYGAEACFMRRRL